MIKIQFKTMNKIHYDYKYNKILKELEQLRFYKVLVMWRETNKDGTIGIFQDATLEDCILRSAELISSLNEI